MSSATRPATAHQHGRVLGLPTADGGVKAVRSLERSGVATIVFEQAPSASELEAAGGRGVLLSEIVAGVHDVYSPHVVDEVADLLRRLKRALAADRWCHDDVPLWDAVVCDFYWRCLDPLLRHVDAAEQLLDRLVPSQIAVSGEASPFARVLGTVARCRGLSVVVPGPRDDTGSAATWARVVPYLAHIRDCLRIAGVRARRARSSRPVVLLNHTWRNFEVVEPAFHELQDRLSPARVMVVQSSREGVREIDSRGFVCRPYDAYVSLTGGFRALAGASRVLAFLASGQWQSAVAAEHVTWRGIPMEVLGDRAISVGLVRLIGNLMRELACAQTLLAREQPSLVVTTEDRSTATRALAYAARARAVPSVMVQWGPIGRSASWWPKVATDVAAVEGEAAAAVLRRCEDGTSLRIVVTGQPKYDRLLEESRTASRAATCAQLRLDPERPILLWAAHPIREASARMRANQIEEARIADEAMAVIRAIEAIDHVQLIVKPHPNEGTTLYAELVQRSTASAVRLVPQQESVYPSLFACDAVLTHRSAVGLEGVLLGKPVVIVNFTGAPDVLPYVASGVGVAAHTSADVEPAIRAALLDDGARAQMALRRPAFLRHHVGSELDGATERLVELILRLCEWRPAEVPAEPALLNREVANG